MHSGSGLGNQLFRYVATRTLACDKGYTFSIVAPENFKGAGFMNLDMGVPFPGSYTVGAGGEVIPISSMAAFHEKKVVENGVDIRPYDPEFNFIKDNTIIDGEFQDERYFEHRLDQVDEWLGVTRMQMPDNWCILGFRGGEYEAVPDLFLPEEYWRRAMGIMKKENPNMKFVAVTDDPATARRHLPPEVDVRHDLEMDWKYINNAKYLIIANSSFYILPALLNRRKGKIIAPRYWGRRNTGVWAMPQNYYKRFHYI